MALGFLIAVGVALAALRAGMGGIALFGTGGIMDLLKIVVRRCLCLGTFRIPTGAGMGIGHFVVGPVAPVMLMQIHFPVFHMAGIPAADPLLSGGIIGLLPLAPVVAEGRDLLRMGPGVQLTALALANVFDQTALLAGGLLKHRAFVVNTFSLPLARFAGPVITALIMAHDPFSIDLHGTGVPFGPVVLRIFHGTEALGTVDHMMHAVAGIPPVIGIVSSGGFPGVVFVDLAAAFRAGHPMAQLVVFRIGGAFLTGGMARIVKGCTALDGADPLMDLLRIRIPGTPDMGMGFLARVGAVEVNGIHRALQLLPEAVRGHDEVLFLAVDLEAQGVLQLAFRVHAVERLGEKHRRIIGEAVFKNRLPERFIEFLTVLAEQHAPPLGVALLVGLLVVIVAHGHHRADPEIGDPEAEVVFVILHGGTVAVILLIEHLIGNDTLHDPFQGTQTLYGDGAVPGRGDGDRTDGPQSGDIAVVILKFQMVQILQDLLLVEESVRLTGVDAVKVHHIGYAVAVAVGFKNIGYAVGVFIHQQNIGPAVLVDVRIRCGDLFAHDIVFLTDLGHGDEGCVGIHCPELLVGGDPGVDGDTLTAVGA